MAKSFFYFIILLKDQSRGLTRLIQLSRKEKRIIQEQDFEKLSTLVEEKRKLIRSITSLEMEKNRLWKSIKELIDRPSNRIELIQAAECKALLKKHRSFARTLSKINSENIASFKKLSRARFSQSEKLLNDEQGNNRIIQQTFTNHF